MAQIQIKGINRALPQADVPDGYCQEIINARIRKGCWRPIPAKTSLGSSVFTYNSSAIVFDAIYLHDIEGGIISGQPNWIGYKLDTNHGDLYLINPTTGVCTLLESGMNTGTNNDFDITVSFLKRFMLVATGEGLFMYLFVTGSPGSYSKVQALPVPQVDMVKSNLITMKYPQFDISRWDNNTNITEKQAACDSLLGNYYATLNAQSSLEGRLFGSIMYMAAYRLFDGSYILPSVPRYFEISNAGIVVADNGGGSGNYGAWMELSMAGIRASINNSYSAFTQTKDLVESICVFATKVTPQHKIDETTITPTKVVVPNTDSTYNKTLFSTFFPLNPEFPKLAESEGWYKIHEFRFDTVVDATERLFADVDTKGYYQDYATREALPADSFSHHSIVARSLYTYNDRLHACGIKTLYGDAYAIWPKFVPGYDMGIENQEGKVIVWLKTSLGEAVVVTDIDIPTYLTATDTAVNYASQAAADAALIYGKANPPPNYVTGSAFWKRKNIPAANPDVVDLAHVTTVDTPNVESWDVCYRTTLGATPYVINPSVIGYNDSRAYRMMITYNSGGTEKVLIDQPLKKNIGLNFAYYHSTEFDALNLSTTKNYKELIRLPAVLTINATVPTAVLTPFDGNRIQVSEIQNPLVYPAKNSYQVGTGDILGVAAGSEPLSLGQFGQFPLQVFTTKGIWAMEIGSGDILYSNILPVNGEVADNAKNIIPLMGGVLYSTVRGLFVINGRQVVQLSEIIEGSIETSLTGSAEIQTLITDSKFTSGLSSALSDIDFLTYLASSSVGYDQINKELIVTNSAKGYSYIYSFESKSWFKVSGSYSLLINNWPKLYGVTATNVMDLSTEATSGYVDVMIISCCQSFEMPGILKKINRMILRSKITTDTDKQVGLYLFATDDAETYQLITGQQRTGTGLKDLVLSRSAGSAKFYVFVINGRVNINSEIDTIDLLAVPKWNNRLR